MKAYAIFDGGGIKGAALAGCLHAASLKGVKFQGYGGTSAGSIVATLAAVGYTGQEIRDLLLDRLHPKKMFPDNGRLLHDLQQRFRMLRDLTDNNSMVKLLKILWQFYQIKKSLSGYGLYAGSIITDRLTSLICQKFPQLNGKDILFSDLKELGCPSLKIVASDVTNRKAVVFGDSDTSYGSSISESIRASICYPFVFQPVIANQCYLADGGLASNLPSFLFGPEHIVTRYPILAFDLVPMEAGTICSNKSILEYGKDLLDTALEASDSIYVESSSNIHRIMIHVPSSISTFKIDISSDELDSLFNIGFRMATEFFDTSPRFKIAMQAGGDLIKNLCAFYCEPKLILMALEYLVKKVSESSGAKDVRACVMLPTGRPEGSRIVAYAYGYRIDDADRDLELDEEGGCSGEAFISASPSIADLHEAKTDYEEWKMTIEQQSKIPGDRKSMYCVPIFPYSRTSAMPIQKKPIGTLSVDSSTSLADTRWSESDGDVTLNLLIDTSKQISKLFY